jgi:protein-tyrosine-phosphatase
MKKIIVVSVGVMTYLMFTNQLVAQTFSKNLQAYSISLEDDFNTIEEARKEKLEQMANYMVQSKNSHGSSKLLFVCTHNSRRSHFSQIWMQTAAYYYGVDKIDTYSGGTEATAANKRAMDALKRAGFSVSSSKRNDGNHVYMVSQGPDFSSNLLFSKKYSNQNNPQEEFAAVMVCSDADKSCPIVYGAEDRISLPFDDPRYYDDTPSEKEKYDETCRLIATEMFYAMSLVKEMEVQKHEQSK